MSTPGDLTAHQNVGVDPRVCQKWGVRRDRYPNREDGMALGLEA